MSRYMFSKAAGLLCAVEEDGSYWVLNGAWKGIREGDNFKVMYGDSVRKECIIKDWKEVDPDTWSVTKQEAWYYR